MFVMEDQHTWLGKHQCHSEKKSLLQESGYLMHWNQLTSLYLRHIDPVEKLLCNTVAEWDVNSFVL